MRDTMARAGRCQSRRAKGSPALASPLPRAGGTSNSTNSAVLHQQANHHVGCTLTWLILISTAVCGSIRVSPMCSKCRKIKALPRHPLVKHHDSL